VLDLVQAHIHALENLDKHPNGKYNLGNGQGFSNLEVVKTVELVTSRKVSFEFAPRRPGDPAVLIASSDLARQELHWNPKHAKPLSYQPGQAEAGEKIRDHITL
jgi:UDP-glucose 4-epimerase